MKLRFVFEVKVQSAGVTWILWSLHKESGVYMQRVIIGCRDPAEPEVQTLWRPTVVCVLIHLLQSSTVRSVCTHASCSVYFQLFIHELMRACCHFWLFTVATNQRCWLRRHRWVMSLYSLQQSKTAGRKRRSRMMKMKRRMRSGHGVQQEDLWPKDTTGRVWTVRSDTLNGLIIDY